MFFKLISNLLLAVAIADNCVDLKTSKNFKFYLWKPFQRSSLERLFVDNVDNLEACTELAVKYKGLALNFAPKLRFLKKHKVIAAHDHYWHLPHLYFNCHILQCPENNDFKTMVNDSSFDYYALYEQPMNYVCLPEIGLFQLHTRAETFQNATLKCHQTHNYCGTLAHIASQKRTEALARLIANYNEQQLLQVKPKIYLAYVGLQYNSTGTKSMDFYNVENENLKCFAYIAWEAGNPKFSSALTNESCVALTLKHTWKTVNCKLKLPFICEIWTSCRN